MTRNYTRKMRGGEVNIEMVKTTIGQLKEDVSRITADIETLGKNLELNGSPEVLSEQVNNEIQQNEIQQNEIQVSNDELRNKQMQVVDEVNNNLLEYAKIMKELGDERKALPRAAKELLLENMKTNKTLLEEEGISEEWLNSMKTEEDINLYEDLKKDIKNKITSIEAYLNQYCYTDGVFKKTEKVCQNKDNSLQVFGNSLNKNVSNNNIEGLKDLQTNISGYIARNKLKVQGGRKTKKNQKKSRNSNKSRRHNKSRK